jgi:hypothetical protein
MSPELPAYEQTSQSLVLPPVRIVGTRYLILHDGTVVSALKPRRKGNLNYWSLCIDGHLKVVTQKTIDEAAKSDGRIG